MPQRIQLSRKKGWRKPDGAITVARPSRWGNPFKVGAPAPTTGELVRDRAHAVELYRAWLPGQPTLIEEARRELAGHDLACWCPRPGPCHADVLIEVANAS